MSSRRGGNTRRGGRGRNHNPKNRDPPPHHSNTPSRPPLTPTRNLTGRGTLDNLTIQQDRSVICRDYLNSFLLQYTEEGRERNLPRKILNTSIFFKKLMKLEDLSILREVLLLLTCPALTSEQYRDSDTVQKVQNSTKEQLNTHLVTATDRLLLQIPTPSIPTSGYLLEKIQFVQSVTKLVLYYGLELEVKENILLILKESFDREQDYYEPSYVTQSRNYFEMIENNIENPPVQVVTPSLAQSIISMLPSVKELLDRMYVINPKPLIIEGEYQDTQSFLRIHYNLLREDMVRPLRYAIQEYTQGDKREARRSLYIYNEVRFLSPECDQNQGLMYRLQFNVSGVSNVNRIKWDRCERLKFGTLLCIVEEHDGRAEFRDVLWAIVADRNARSLQREMVICVKFPCGYQPRVNFSQNYFMLESRDVYFESYCHTLSVLDSMREIPFTRVLLGQSLECAPPKYLTQKTLYNLSSIFPDNSAPVFPCLCHEEWPTTSPKLDSSQYQAVRLALSKEVCLIQGPPGTGKTYVGALTLEILLQTKNAYYHNLNSWFFSDNEMEQDTDTDTDTLQNISIPSTPEQDKFMEALESPILILTYTNHALDQFLMLLLRFESKIVRIGSKIEQEELSSHSLAEIRKSLLPPRREQQISEKREFLPDHIFKLKKQRGELLSKAWEMKNEMSQIAKKLTEQRILHGDLKNICSKPQLESFMCIVRRDRKRFEDVLDEWKGEELPPAPVHFIPCPPRTRERREEVEYYYVASDDEDMVDGRDYNGDMEEYASEEMIAVWDDVHQVLSDFELDQVKSKMPNIPKHLKNVGDLWSLEVDDREKLYEYWLDLKRKLLSLMVEERSEMYAQLCADIQKVNREIDLCILREAAVVGMTTTGAARNSELIRQLNPRIIFVEEAAEVLEAHIIAALTKHVQHLILIGDHQQLRPSNADYDLAQKANLNISLFERLIRKKVEHVTLQYQHRMRPEISQLVRHIYPNLIDHEVVQNYEVLYGVRRNIFFIDHEIPEDNLDKDNTSKTHSYEARYLAHLANYLVNRGYTTDEITILTFYRGQQFCIIDELRRVGLRIRVSTVDKYQGEENRVVLFSVVRSNKQNNIGHCRVDNRVCVALSRAKEGLVMIGNATSLRKASRNPSDLWNVVLDTFGSSRVNRTFPLYCHRHPDANQGIHSPEELAEFKDGVCKRRCDGKLECGHDCTLLCHYISHSKVKCKELCERVKEECGHPCVREDGVQLKFCSERCGRCNFKVTKSLEMCGHEKMLPCHKAPTHDLCTELCEKTGACGHPCVQVDGKSKKFCSELCGDCNYLLTKTIDECGHQKELPCHRAPTHDICTELCEKTGACGHPCVEKDGWNTKPCAMPCGSCNYPVLKTLPCSHEQLLACRKPPEKVICTQPCKKIKPCNHLCKGECNKDCSLFRCEVLVLCELPCTHSQELKCFIDPSRHECHQPCLKRLKCDHLCPRKCHQSCDKVSCMSPCELERACGHPCVRKDQTRKKCSEECGLCVFSVEKTIEGCSHRVMLPCSVDPVRSLCTKQCKRILPCGHPCELKCAEKCPEECKRIVPKFCRFGHLNEMPCWFSSDEFVCKQSCPFLLPCRHSCPLTCGEECENAVCEEPCLFKCDNGHPCVQKNGEPKACHEDCGKCLKVISKKLESCGHEMELPCWKQPLHSLCVKRCNKTKDCRHICTGKCGQECSSVKCEREVKRELSCRHVKKLPCYVPLDSIKCDEKCQKKLPCGHPCLKKCFEDCSESICQVTKKTDLKCGHTVTFSCHEEMKKIIPLCPEPCERKLPCGHDCTGDCGDLCSEIICQVKVKLTLNCEHGVSFNCDKATRIFSHSTPEELAHVIHCRTRDCETCYSVKSSIKCTHECNKQLECTHNCVTRCHFPAPCPPCREACLSKCVHSRCHLPCGDMCVRCEEPCEWGCKHLQCTRKCWEPCDRFVCNKRCQLDLMCGHTCLGLCGEKCPDVCIACTPGGGHTSDPLVSLGCGHNIPVGILDEIFDNNRDDVSIPCCPRCNDPLYVTQRYGKAIKVRQSKMALRKRFRAIKLSDQLRDELNSLTNPCYIVKPVPLPLDDFLNILFHIQKNLSDYQLTKLYTMIDLLRILAGVIHHTPEAWHSSHHSKLINFKTLNLLIDAPTAPDDSRGVDYIRSLCLRCELCSLASILSSRKLSREDSRSVEVSFDLFFSEKKLEDKIANSYLTNLNGFIAKYSIKSAYLVKSNFSLQENSSDSDLHGTNFVNENVATPKRAKVEKEGIIASKKTKRAASPDLKSQPKPKITKIEFQDSRPQSEERKVTFLPEDKKKKKPSRWGQKDLRQKL